MPIPSTPRVPWHAVLIALLTIGLVGVFLHSINLAEAWHALLDANLWWIVLAALVTLQTYTLRARRWQSILRPIGRVSFRNAFRTTVIGYTASALLPARVGEILRPYLLAREERLDPAAAFATIIVERVLDLCMVLLLFAIALLTVGGGVGRDVKIAGAVLAVGSVCGVGLLVVLAGHPEHLGRWASRMTRRLPPKLGQSVSRLVEAFVHGLKVMRSPSNLLVALGWSVPLWLSIALGILFTSWAFDLTIPFTGAFLVMGYLTVGVAAPTPGAAGGFHLAYKLALETLVADPAKGPSIVAAAVVLHLVSLVPVTLLGAGFLWQDGLTLGRLKGMQSEARQAEAPSVSG